MDIPPHFFGNMMRKAFHEDAEFDFDMDNPPPEPGNCPECGTVMTFGKPLKTSPVLIRIIPELGYIPGNVRWECTACHSRKVNA